MGKGKNALSYCLIAYSQLFLLAFMGALITGFGYYGFIGEGDWNCYATQNDSETIPWDTTTGSSPPDDYHHVNANFKVVCIWGCISYTISYLTVLTLMCASERFISSGWFVFFALMTLATHFAHLITMMVLRWRHAGKTCSGDYLTSPNRYSLFDE